MTTAWLTEYRPKVGQRILVFVPTSEEPCHCEYLGEDHRYLFVRLAKKIRSYPLAQVSFIEWTLPTELKQGEDDDS